MVISGRGDYEYSPLIKSSLDLCVSAVLATVSVYYFWNPVLSGGGQIIQLTK